MTSIDLATRISWLFPQPIFSRVYDTSGRMVYLGIANKGSTLAGSQWMVVKYWYNTDGRLLHERVSDPGSIFNNYATLNYYASDLP